MKILDKIEDFIVLGSLAFMGIIMAVQVFFRYCFNQPLTWSEELVRYVFVWMTFIGAGYGIRRNTHIRMEIIPSKLPKMLKDILSIVSNIFIIFILINLIPEGIEFSRQQSSIMSSALGVPMGLVTLPLPIGFTIMVIRLSMESIDTMKSLLKNKREELKVKC